MKIVPAISADMELSSIPAAWLISGEGITKSRVLGKTRDHLAYVILWECGSARFRWDFVKDEFFIIVSGDAYLMGAKGRERHFGVSDTGFFHAGSSCEWRVPVGIRKIAIVKSSIPWPMSFIVRAWAKIAGGRNGH
jgi:uncharacterized protein